MMLKQIRAGDATLAFMDPNISGPRGLDPNHFDYGSRDRDRPHYSIVEDE
jgi:hypothetical protein